MALDTPIEQYIEDAIKQHLIDNIVESSVTVHTFLTDDSTSTEEEARSLPEISIVSTPVQQYQELVEIPIEIEIITNHATDKKRTVLNQLISNLHEGLDADQIDTIDNYIPGYSYLAGFGLWQNQIRDIVSTDNKVLNYAIINLVAFMQVGSSTTTTTTEA